MRQIVWTLAPVALGAMLALAAIPAQAAPTDRALPELILPVPRAPGRPSAQVEPKRDARGHDLGDYDVPGERSSQPAGASAPARA